MRKNESMNNIERNEMLDNIIRWIFSSYPGKCLRKVIDDIDIKYNHALSASYILSKTDNEYKRSTMINDIVYEVIIESSKMLHQYLGIAIDELPSICIAPYLRYIGINNEKRIEIIKNMYGNHTIKECIELCDADRINELLPVIIATIMLKL